MIQRIQSLYLAMAAMLMSITLSVPLARLFEKGDEIARLTAFGFAFDGAPVLGSVFGIAMGVMCTLGALLPFLAVFLYARRPAQMALCKAAMVVQATMALMLGWMLWSARPAIGGTGPVQWVPAVADVFPLIAIVLAWMALRAIRKDDDLVRSVDRIR